MNSEVALLLSHKTRTKLTRVIKIRSVCISSMKISQLPERQDWCWLSEEFLADPVTHKHTDMTDYNTLCCSLARSVINLKQTPVKHCTTKDLWKFSFFHLVAIHQESKQFMGWNILPQRYTYLCIVQVESGIPPTRTTCKTRSSADADNRLDASSGQSRSTNMVPFHM